MRREPRAGWTVHPEYYLAGVWTSRRPVMERRWLVSAYRLKDSVLAWECVICGKLFSLSVADAERSTRRFPPPHIEREFRLHNCELQLSRELSETDL
jgi:hypothetical protein